MARYIKLHDSILQWQWFHDANTLRLWLYLLLNAQYADGNQLKRGQMMISQRMLCKTLNISYKTLRRSLNALISSGCITVSIVDYSGSLITICNYDKYQGVCSNSNTPVCSNSNTPYAQTTTGCMSKLQQGVCQNSTTYTEEEKEIYKEKEREDKSSLRKAPDGATQTEKAAVYDFARRTAMEKPTLADVKDYLFEQGYTDVDAETFWNFYESKGWMIGRNKMKNWHSAIATWRRKNQEARGGRNIMINAKNNYANGENRIDSEARQRFSTLQSAIAALQSGSGSDDDDAGFWDVQ